MCVYIYIYVCMYVCICTYIYVYIYICIYLYIYRLPLKNPSCRAMSMYARGERWGAGVETHFQEI